MDIVAQTVIEHFAAENADLREANRQLVDLVVDLAFDLEIAKQFVTER